MRPRPRSYPNAPEEMNDSWEATALRCFTREEEERREREEEVRRWEREEKARKREAAKERARMMSPETSGEDTDFGCVFKAAKFLGLWFLFSLLVQSAALGLLLTIAAPILLRVLPPRIAQRKRDRAAALRIAERLRRYRAGDQAVVLDVYRFAVEEFRTKIDAHRSRTLGGGSEWAAARGKLAGALDEADRSAAYWRNRLRQERNDQVIARQLKTADRLYGKLRAALAKLDGRADVLRRFYNECEAKISAMDRYNSDIEETRRLERLSGTADMVIADAESTLTGIGASFMREAQKVGEVFGSFERLQLSTLAGEAPLDDIEFLADRINEASESKYDSVEELSQVIEEFSEPIN